MKILKIEIESENDDVADFTEELRNIAVAIEQGYLTGSGWDIEETDEE
jgi:hypothetical protein